MLNTFFSGLGWETHHHQIGLAEGEEEGYILKRSQNEKKSEILSYSWVRHKFSYLTHTIVITNLPNSEALQANRTATHRKMQFAKVSHADDIIVQFFISFLISCHLSEGKLMAVALILSLFTDNKRTEPQIINTMKLQCSCPPNTFRIRNVYMANWLCTCGKYFQSKAFETEASSCSTFNHVSIKSSTSAANAHKKAKKFYLQ